MTYLQAGQHLGARVLTNNPLLIECGVLNTPELNDACVEAIRSLEEHRLMADVLLVDVQCAQDAKYVYRIRAIPGHHYIDTRLLDAPGTVTVGGK